MPRATAELLLLEFTINIFSKKSNKFYKIPEKPDYKKIFKSFLKNTL